MPNRPLYDALEAAIMALQDVAALLEETTVTTVVVDEIGPCDLGHPACEDACHSEAYHSCDCTCGATEATCPWA